MISFLRAGWLTTVLAGSALSIQAPVSTPLPPPAAPAQAPTGTPELLLDQGKRLFDALQYDQAVPVFDRLVALLTPGGQVQRPDVLVQAYELRARSRYALGDSAGTEQDFSSLLLVKPDFKLGAGISSRVVAIFDSVRKLTIGQVNASLTPAGDVQIDGQPYSFKAEPQLLDFPVGDHQVTATRPGYRPIAQKFTVAAGEPATLALSLERVSATLTVVTIPDGVDVVLDGAPHGQTQHGSTPDESAPLQLTDLATGNHRLQLHRDCFKDMERSIAIERPEDLQTGPLRLTPATAAVKVESAESGATVLLDGGPRGTVPADLTVCEGPHLIEVKGAKGRFMDRRAWKTGDAVTLSADLRTAFPIVMTRTSSTLTQEQLRAAVERALSPARRVLVYSPGPGDLDGALSGENIPPDWLAPDPADSATALPRIPKEVKRDIGRKLASKLDAQGVAAVTAGSDPYTASISLLAAGSGDPDVITINTADPASVTRGLEILGRPLPPIIAPSIETAVVDLAGVQGALVVRTAGVGAKAGLAPGDVIVGAGGTPVASVADLRARVAAARPPATTLSLDVKSAAGATRKVDVAVTMAPDTIPLRDPGLLYNGAFADLQDALKGARTPLEKSAVHLNLAIVHMRLGNWDDAQGELKEADLPDGAGVSAGTVAYLTGLCLEATGRAADAQAAFTKAAASTSARLANDGPLVAVLAQQKLQRR
jgi:tetratricopeptide (TPR) repeat protein